MVLQQQRDDGLLPGLGAGGGVVQGRPAGLVDIGVTRQQGLHCCGVAFEGGHHQRGFARTVFGLHVQVARGQQRLGGLE